MKAFLLSALSMIVILSASAQGDILNEEFDDNKNDWELKKDDQVRVIENGKLRINVAADTYYYTALDVMPDKKKNFRVETQLQFVKYKSGEAGIMWGGGEGKDKKLYFFIMRPTGSWNYGMWSPKFYSYTGSQKSPHVNKGDGVNKLAIEKVGGKLKFFVNDVEVHSAKFPSTKGSLLGLVSGDGVHLVEADYFKVSSIQD